MRKFIVSVLFLSLLVVCLVVGLYGRSESNEDEPIGEKKFLEIMTGRIKKLKEQPLIFEGVFIDQDGQPLDDVTVKIDKSEANWATLTETEKSETHVLSRSFSFQFSDCDAAEFWISKSGYRPALRLAVSYDPSDASSRVRTNQRIVLKKIGELTSGVENYTMYLRYKKVDGKITRAGWSSEKKRYKYDYYNRPFSNPIEIDFYVEFNTEGAVVLKAGERAGLLLMDPTVPNFDPVYQILAPESGYVREVVLKPLADSNSVADSHYLYFLTKKNTYGKMRIKYMQVNDQSIYIPAGYYLNTTGSRELNTEDF